MPSLTLRPIPEALLTELRARAELHAWSLRDTVLFLLRAGLDRDPKLAGRRGGCMRALRLSAAERTAIARQAAHARWHPEE